MVESGENVTISISGALNAVEFATQSQIINIIDDDIAEVVFTTSTGYLQESGGVVVFTLATSGDVIVNTGIIVYIVYTITPSTGASYTGSVSATILAFATGTSFSMTGINNNIYEGNKINVFDVTTVTNASEYGTQTQTITMLDDELAPNIALTGGTGISENG